MMTHGTEKRSEEPPDLSRDPSGTSGDPVSHSEWPYFVFVAGLFLLITLKSLVFS
jgi:hypothetical protein